MIYLVGNLLWMFTTLLAISVTDSGVPHCIFYPNTTCFGRRWKFNHSIQAKRKVDVARGDNSIDSEHAVFFYAL